MFNKLHNTKNGFALIGILVAVFIVAAIIFGSSFFWKRENAPSPKKSIDTLNQAKSDLGDINNDLKDRNNEIQKVQDDANLVGEVDISIDSINPNDTIDSPVVIEGTAPVVSKKLVVELRNKEHDTMVSEYVNVKPEGAIPVGSYSITLHFQFNNTKDGYVAVYKESAKDGSEMNLVEIPVKFKSVEDK